VLGFRRQASRLIFTQCFFAAKSFVMNLWRLPSCDFNTIDVSFA
jgi:hypothetical protein